MKLIAAFVLMLSLSGCLTPLGTRVSFKGDAAAGHQLLAPDEEYREELSGVYVDFEYKTTADKTISYQRHNTDKEGNDWFTDFMSTSDSQAAVEARNRDNERFENVSGDVFGLVGQTLQFAAQAYGLQGGGNNNEAIAEALTSLNETMNEVNARLAALEEERVQDEETQEEPVSEDP